MDNADVILCLESWRAIGRLRGTRSEDLVKVLVQLLQAKRNAHRKLCHSGAAQRVAAKLLDAAAKRSSRPPLWNAYECYATWSLSDVDPYRLASLRLMSYIFPSQPQYAWQRLALEHAAAAGGLESAVPEFCMDQAEDIEAHGAVLEAVIHADVDVLRRLLVTSRGYRLASCRCAATGRTPMHTLATGREEEDATACLELLIHHGADVNASDSTGLTPLHLASRTVRPALGKLLIAFGAAVDAVDNSNRTPLHHLAAALLVKARTRDTFFRKALSDAKELARLLLRSSSLNLITRRDRFGITPLALACAGGNECFGLCALLLDADFENHADFLHDALKSAARSGASSAVSLLLKKCSNVILVPLLVQIAVKAGHCGVVAALAESGGILCVETDKWTPLHVASRLGDEAMCSVLLDHGCKQSLLVASLEEISKMHWLDTDAGGPRPEAVSRYIRLGRQEVLAWTPAAIAALCGHNECVPQNALSIQGVGLVSAAILGGRSIRLLLQTMGARPKSILRAVNSIDACIGLPPILLAAALGDADAVAELRSAGADMDAHRRPSLLEIEQSRRAEEQAKGCLDEKEAEFKSLDFNASKLNKARTLRDSHAKVWSQIDLSTAKSWFAAETPPSEFRLRAARLLLRCLGSDEESWTAARKRSRQLRFPEELLAFSRRDRSPSWIKSDELTAMAADADDKSLSLWFQGVLSTRGLREHEAALKAEEDLEKAALASKTASIKRNRLQSLGVGVGGLIAALASPGAPRGDCRGPARCVREARDRTETATLMMDSVDTERREPDLGRTALSVACDRGYWSVARLLLDKCHAHPDGGDFRGGEQSPLAVAAAHAHEDPEAYDLVQDLLAAGASLYSTAGVAAVRVSCSANLAARLAVLGAPGTGIKRAKAILCSSQRCQQSLFYSPVVSGARSVATEEALIELLPSWDHKDLEELTINGAPRTTYRKRNDGLLVAIDKSHEHYGLLLSTIDDVYHVELEDGSWLPLAHLRQDPRYYWQLSTTLTRPQTTALHVVASAGNTEACALALRLGSDLLAVDTEGYSALGLALRGGHAETAIWLAGRRRLMKKENEWRPEFDALFVAPERRRVTNAQLSLKRAAALGDDDFEQVAPSGLVARLAQLLVQLHLSRPQSEELLWHSEAPPLRSAEVAREACDLLGFNGSASLSAFSSVAEPLLDSIPVSSLIQLKRLLFGAVSASMNRFDSSLEPTLWLFHSFSDAKEEEEEDDEENTVDGDLNAAVPEVVLREVRTAVVSSGSVSSRLNNFMQLWREHPGRVTATLRSARRVLLWLGKLATARLLMLCSGAKGSKQALTLATEALTRRFRWLGMTAELDAAKRAVARAERYSAVVASSSGYGSTRSVELLRRADWLELLVPIESPLAECRSQLLDAFSSLLPESKSHIATLKQSWSQQGKLDAATAAQLLLEDIKSSQPVVSNHAAVYEAVRKVLVKLKTSENASSSSAQRAAEAACFWIRTELQKTKRKMSYPEENVLLEVVNAFGDTNLSVVLAILQMLGTEKTAMLAVSGTPSPLKVALSLGHWQTSNAILRAGAESQEPLLRTALEVAPQNGDAKDTLSLLLTNEQIGSNDEELIEIAARKGYLEFVGQLLAAGITLKPPLCGCLHVAARHGNVLLIVRLLSALFAIDGQDGVRSALCNERQASYPIHEAVRGGHTAAAGLLIDALRDPEAIVNRSNHISGRNSYYDTPLGVSLLQDTIAARQPAILGMLLTRGGFTVSSSTSLGKTSPIQMAVDLKCAQCVITLLRAGAVAEPSLARGAAAAGAGEVALILLNAILKDRDLKRLDLVSGVEGQTMLHFACRCRASGLAQLLLASGASLSVKDDKGALPLHYAIAAGDAATTQLLATFCRDYHRAAMILTRALRRRFLYARRISIEIEEEIAARRKLLREEEKETTYLLSSWVDGGQYG